MSYQKDVEDFMSAGDQPINKELSLQGDQQKLYMNLITEEYKETLEAFENKSIRKRISESISRRTQEVTATQWYCIPALRPILLASWLVEKQGLNNGRPCSSLYLLRLQSTFSHREQ